MQPGHQLRFAGLTEVGPGEEGQDREHRRQPHHREAVVRDLKKALGDIADEGPRALGQFAQRCHSTSFLRAERVVPPAGSTLDPSAPRLDWYAVGPEARTVRAFTFRLAGFGSGFWSFPEGTSGRRADSRQRLNTRSRMFGIKSYSYKWYKRLTNLRLSQPEFRGNRPLPAVSRARQGLARYELGASGRAGRFSGRSSIGSPGGEPPVRFTPDSQPSAIAAGLVIENAHW